MRFRQARSREKRLSPLPAILVDATTRQQCYPEPPAARPTARNFSHHGHVFALHKSYCLRNRVARSSRTELPSSAVVRPSVAIDPETDAKQHAASND